MTDVTSIDGASTWVGRDVRFGHGHGVYYRDGAYVDQYLYQMDRDTWNERWPGEREYPPLGDEKAE